MVRPAGSLAAPAAAWQTASPSDAGFAPDLEARFDQLVAEKRAWALHGVVVVRGRRIVLERYFEAEDQTWGKPLGRVKFGPDALHDIRSVTKSIVALVYGIALAEGKVPAPDRPLFAQFPEYADLVAADERRKQQTIAHALTMSLGTRWNEIGIPYDSPANDEIGMEMAKGRYRFVLERPVIGPPGKRWIYNGGATALLGRVIAKGTYGYQWYVGDFGFGTRANPRLERWVGGFGNGGQRLFVMPDLDLVVAITAGNYNTPDQGMPPIRVMREAVLASIR
jgi:CubicO group peptidase (beta-lactamase class C family)